MPQLFESIDTEKQQRVINAALDEFASKGYKQATTDNIVIKAGISKGSLFKYFKSKEALLLYLCDYAYEIIFTEYFADDMIETNDFFEMFGNSMRRKFEILFKYPSIYAFFVALYTDGTEAANEWLRKKSEYAKARNIDALGEYDRTKFKEDLDIDMAVSIVRRTFDCLTNELVDKLKTGDGSVNVSDVRMECDSHLTFFKKIFYREEL